MRKKRIKLKNLNAMTRELLVKWARDVVRGDIEEAGRYAMAKSAKRQAARDKVKAKTKAKAKAVEQITAKKSSRKKKRGR